MEKSRPIPPPTFRDQFMRLIVGPGDYATRLVATSLYGRIHVAKGAQREKPAEPVVFRGSIGIPQFSLDGQRLLILSGAMFNVFDSVRLVDVSPLYRPQEAATKKLEDKTCASMVGRHCQRSERLRSQSRWLFDDTGRCAEEVSREQSW